MRAPAERSDPAGPGVPAEGTPAPVVRSRPPRRAEPAEADHQPDTRSPGRRGASAAGRGARAAGRKLTPSQPPTPAILVRGVAAMFLVVLSVAGLTVAAFALLGDTNPHVVRTNALEPILSRGDVAIVHRDVEVVPGAMVGWTDADGDDHVHRAADVDAWSVTTQATTGRPLGTTLPLEDVEGAVERRVPLLGLLAIWWEDEAFGRLGALAGLVLLAIATLAAVPLRAGIVGQRKHPGLLGGPQT